MAMSVRPVEDTDIPAMAALRAREWESATFWNQRIRWYLSGEHSPREGLPARAGFVAVEGDALLGFIAGHRTRRYGCNGELQWMNVALEHRGAGVADAMLAAMAAWFVRQGARRVCVDVEPKNTAARAFYARHGAQPLNPH
jgi:GNAT superfamily N-acetyltransferase